MLRSLYCICGIAVFLLGVRANTISAQNEVQFIDSLKQNLKTLKTDSAFSYAYDEIALKYSSKIPDSGIVYANKALFLGNKINKFEYQIDPRITLGIIYRERGEYNTSIKLLLEALEIAQKNEAKSHYFERIYTCLNLSYTEQGNYTVGIEYGFKGLKEIEKKHDTLAMALSNNNIANTYFKINQYDKAMQYYKIALGYAMKVKHLYGQSLLTGNIGSVFFEIGKYDSAKIYFDKSLTLSKQVEDASGEAVQYINIGSYYQKVSNDKVAIDYFKKAENIFTDLKMQPNLSDVYIGLAASYLNTKEYNSSLVYANKSLELANKIESFPEKENAHLALKNVYEKLNNTNQAYYHYKEYIAARDSTFNEKNKKEQFKAELVYEYDKKKYSDSLDQVLTAKIQQKELSQEREKTETQRKLTYVAVAGCVLFLVLALYIFKNYKDKQKANKIISEQKNQVEIQNEKIEFQKAVLEEKNKEIIDSIYYASRIQQSLLPTQKYIDKNLKRLQGNK